MKNMAAVCVTLAALTACAGVGEKTDTSKILPVDDIYARDTTPPAPPPRVAKLAILDDSVPEGGVCNVKRYARNADQAREVFYETMNPQRSYVLEIGKGLRQFGPVSLDMKGVQTTPDLTEIENVYAGFTADGKVSVGTRRYSASGSQTVNDRMFFDFTDSAKVLAIAKKIVEKCDVGR